MLIVLGDTYTQIPRRQRVLELMTATQERARAEPGCISYAFAETLDDPGHFAIVQQWESQAALDAHYRSAAFIDYQAQIGELTVRDSDLRIYRVEEHWGALDSAPMDPRRAD
jgi:quinol monooxygenase YgiN